MSPYSQRSQGGRFTAADGPTAKRIEVWLDPPTLAIVDAHAKAIGQGRGKAIADLLKPTASGGAEPAVEAEPIAASEPAAKPVPAPPKAVREIAQPTSAESAPWPDWGSHTSPRENTPQQPQAASGLRGNSGKQAGDHRR